MKPEFVISKDWCWVCNNQNIKNPVIRIYYGKKTALEYFKICFKCLDKIETLRRVKQ